jgi:hypothetical protein
MWSKSHKRLLKMLVSLSKEVMDQAVGFLKKQGKEKDILLTHSFDTSAGCWMK